MDYRSTVLQRPQEDEDEPLRRDRMNGGSNQSQSQISQPPRSARSPKPSDFPQPFSPTKAAHPRPQFNNQYHPPTPAPLPLPTSQIGATSASTSSAHVAQQPPLSPLAATTPSYASELDSAPRDKPMSNYYDPTSDSSERKPALAEASSASASATAWNNGYAQTPQVRPLSSSQAPPVRLHQARR
jgi:hypothetical protein